MRDGAIDFSGIWLPLVTPFEADAAAVDHPALARLVRRLAAQGVAGFVACGSTGEAAMLDEAEQQAVLATVLGAAGGKPVLMGLAGVRPERVAQRAQALAAASAPAGWLLTAPAYVKPSQAGIVDFFHRVVEATPLPVVAYDIPARTGVRIQPATLLALAEHPRIVAVKDCSADRAAAEAIVADGRLALLAGNDDELFDQLARGAAGAITASAHLATAQFVALAAALRGAGRLEQARALWRRLAPVTRAAFAEPNPAPIKAALALGGELHPTLRAPMQSAAPATGQALHAAALAAALPDAPISPR
ncbi:dihydrodipicolinate synthase family protein [Aquabacterium sp. OR-4]|uniref:dihydrodipicolinate synthase family protein n=1 Tax=Aquabacterium sp. OR-4 TaxID=2978127 RepID=UPI0028C93C1C|nr:dihydrodipicolinate synthase family protein [Aquabacterium sp. OR-4]MDT7835523.1 dihydrodipicolinate synthase family protein [Aquabacterium sp. OR-4]